MSNDPFAPGEPPVPPIAGGGADPTLPGGADPTLAQPLQPQYTTGPGMPPDRTVPPPGGGDGGGFGGGGSGGGAYGGDQPGGDRPAWLIPAAVGLVGALVVGVVAFLLLRDDGDDSIASDSSTTLPVADTTLPDGGADTTVPAGTDTTVAPGETTTVPAAPDTTVPEAGATTTVADGGGSTDPCADGYAEVTSLPFGICSQGQTVRDAQFVIARFTPIDVDGFYGPTSFAAVQELQASLGLAPDGIVSQEFLDVLEGVDTGGDFVVASPGTVRILDREYPITRTCRTIPFEGMTADYQVISYVYRDDFGVSHIDRWFDEGGASGVYVAGEDNPVTELSSGFGFDFREGDSVVTASVNPVDAPSDSCVGRVVQSDSGGSQLRVHNVVAACSTGGEVRLQLSEGAIMDVGASGARFSSGPAEGFFFGEDPAASVGGDGSTAQVTAAITSQGETRTFTASYPASPGGC